MSMEKISFGRLPTVLRSQELIDKAFKKASESAQKVQGPPREVAIQREHQRIMVMTSTVSEHLSKSVAGFPSLMNLPPFYRDLVDAIFSIDKLRKSLGTVGGAAKIVDKIRREQFRKLKYSRSPMEAAAIRRQAYGRISSILKNLDGNLVFLKDVSKKLSDLPSVYVDMPTVVIAGYPNVGKSTLLRALTGSAPKIAPYPFTTTGLQLGYFEHSHQRYQVIDTPGLLDRPLEKRNPIELQAISALKNLAKVIVFIMDPSETCGYEMRDQLHLLDDIEKMFAGMKVLVVANKTDMLNEEKISQTREKRSGIFFVTASTGEGVGELRENLL
ncbi:MAG: NOG1 family protein [Methanobacteriota archaeon]